MGTFSTGQAAGAVGVTTKAIRLWEAKGLIPQAERTEARYRQFSNADISVMRFIHQAKMLGMSLDEIKRILSVAKAGASPCDDVRQMIDVRIAEIEQRVAELHSLRQTLVEAKQIESKIGEVCAIIEGVG